MTAKPLTPWPELWSECVKDSVQGVTPEWLLYARMKATLDAARARCEEVELDRNKLADDALAASKYITRLTDTVNCMKQELRSWWEIGYHNAGHSYAVSEALSERHRNEVATLTAERDTLREQVRVLREALTRAALALDCYHSAAANDSRVAIAATEEKP